MTIIYWVPGPKFFLFNPSVKFYRLYSCCDSFNQISGTDQCYPSGTPFPFLLFIMSPYFCMKLTLLLGLLGPMTPQPLRDRMLGWTKSHADDVQIISQAVPWGQCPHQSLDCPFFLPFLGGEASDVCPVYGWTPAVILSTLTSWVSVSHHWSLHGDQSRQWQSSLAISNYSENNWMSTSCPFWHLNNSNSFLIRRPMLLLGIVAWVCNSSPSKVEAKLLWVQGQLEVKSKTLPQKGGMYWLPYFFKSFTPYQHSHYLTSLFFLIYSKSCHSK